MMTIMRMCCAILTIAYYISAIFQGRVITAGFGKLHASGYPLSQEINFFREIYVIMVLSREFGTRAPMRAAPDGLKIDIRKDYLCCRGLF